MNRRLMLQALAFGLMTLPSFALHWAEAVWLMWGLLALITTGMVIGLRVSKWRTRLTVGPV
ncbi:MAG: hypothetical protein ACE5M4_01150 [Anaerolineales bacterium]